jgi:hypothetical protein
MYSVSLKIDGIESWRRSAGILHIVVGFFLILNTKKYLDLSERDNTFLVLSVLCVAIASLAYGFFRRKIDLLAKYNFALRVLQVITFLVLGFHIVDLGTPIDYIGIFLFVVLCLILMFSERRVFQQTVIILDDNGVKIPGLYTDHLVKWQDLSEVVVREDFLTLFHIKKKYLQYQVVQDLSIIEVNKLDLFCKEQIEKTRSMVEK